jgi:hypothetical protein
LTTLELLAAVRDGGNLAALQRNEVRVWIALLSFADYRTRQCFPSVETLSAATGITNHARIRQALASLTAEGWLETVTSSKGRKTVVRTLTVPRPIKRMAQAPTRPVSGLVPTRPGIGPVDDPTRLETVSPTGTVSDANPAGERYPTGPESGPLTHENTFNTSSTPAENDDDGIDLGGEKNRRDRLREELVAAGVRGPNVELLIKTNPHLQPIHVRLSAFRARRRTGEKRVANVGGLVFTELHTANGSPQNTFDPREIAELANAGHVLGICGKAVPGNARVQYNRDGICIGSALVPAKKLTPSAILLEPPEVGDG